MADAESDSLWLRLARLPVVTVQDFVEDDGPTLAGALSFYVLLSLAPMMLVVTELAGWWLGTESAIAQIRIWIRQLVTGEAAAALNELLDQLTEQQILSSTGLMGWVGLGSTLFVATTLVAQLKSGLNRIWRVRHDPERGSILLFLIQRGVALAIVLAMVVAVMASAVLSTVIDQALTWASDLVPGAAESAAYSAGGTLVSLLLLTAVFTVGLKWLPDARIRWRDTLVGGAATAVLIEIGSWLLGWYLGVAAIGSAWGASGAVAVLLVWVFYSANILLIGAELTRCWALSFGGGLEPGRYAVAVRYEIVSDDDREADTAGDDGDGSDDGGNTDEDKDTPAA